MDANVKRDLIRKAILLEIRNRSTRYTKIKDRVTAKCKEFATSNSVKRQFYHYLIPQGYVERISLGKYKITQKGEKLLAVLNHDFTVTSGS